MTAIDDARERWSRADDAWNTITWVLSRDPTKGVPMVEGGQTRSLYVEYEITRERIVITEALFRDATTTAGTA